MSGQRSIQQRTAFSLRCSACYRIVVQNAFCVRTLAQEGCNGLDERFDRIRYVDDLRCKNNIISPFDDGACLFRLFRLLLTPIKVES